MSCPLADAEAALRRLILTYARGVDRLDEALVRAVFWDDAVIELGTIYRGGPSGFAEVAIGFMGAMAATRHQIGNTLVELETPMRAAMESYVTAWHRLETPEGVRTLEVLGRYLTRAEQRDGIWRIVYHCEVIDWGEERQADPSWFDANAEMEKGRRDRGDRSYSVMPGPDARK